MSAPSTAAAAASRNQPIKRSGLDQEEMRRRREQTTVQIRKEKKEDSLQKRRRDVTPAGGGGGGGGPSSAFGAASSSATASTTSSRKSGQPDASIGALPDPMLKLKLDSLPEDMELLRSDDPEVQLEATTRFRKLLSIERNPPIAEVIAAGAVPRLVQYCQCYDNPQLLLEATWTLTNVSSGTSEHTRVVIDNGAVPVFIGLICCPYAEVREQAVWALGNIAGDSTRCRDLVLSYEQPLGLTRNLLGAMGDLTPSGSNLMMLRNATWTISNLCRGKPPPRWPLIAPLLAPLVALTAHSDEEVLVDAAWALSYICEPSDRIGVLLEAGALPRLVELLGHASPAVQTPALRCVGNVAAGTAEQTQMVLTCDPLLPAVGRLLESGKKELKKEACWMVSNLTAGSSQQIDAVCASGMVPLLIRLVASEEFDIKKEAAYALCNACLGGSMQTISGLVSCGVLASLCSLLQSPDADLLLAVCDALGAALEAGEANRQATGGGDNYCAHLVDEAGGVDKLEELQQHENVAVYERASKLIDTYLSDADAAAEDAQIAPRATADQFDFGLPPPAAGGAAGLVFGDAGFGSSGPGAGFAGGVVELADAN